MGPRHSCLRAALNNSASASVHHTFLILFVRLIVSVAQTTLVHPPSPPLPMFFIDWHAAETRHEPSTHRGLPDTDMRSVKCIVYWPLQTMIPVTWLMIVTDHRRRLAEYTPLTR